MFCIGWFFIGVIQSKLTRSMAMPIEATWISMYNSQCRQTGDKNNGWDRHTCGDKDIHVVIHLYYH